MQAIGNVAFVARQNPESEREGEKDHPTPG